MPYALGPVKPHVKAAAEEIGGKFGVRVIYGFRPGGSGEHPKGLALDFMCNKAIGDAISAYVIANAGRLGVDYQIWWYQSWNPRRGTWAKYTSTPNPHIDHVHVSFLSSAGSGPVLDPTGLQQTGVTDSVGKLNDLLKYIVTPGFWKRAGVFAVGFMLIIIGLTRWDSGKAAVQQVATTAKKVGKLL